MTDKSFQRVAHRGGSALAPENTLAAFHRALTLSVDAIELDVQMSCDGYAIVFHDETVERLTDGQGNILDLDLAYLRSLNAAAHFPGGWPEPQQIPTLREVLEVARRGEVQVYIEIKSSRRDDGPYGRYPGIAEAVMQDVLAAGMLDQVMVMAFDWEILPLLKSLSPEVCTGALIAEDIWNTYTSLPDLLAQVRALQVNWANLDYALFTPQLPAMFHAAGLRLGFWTVNDVDGLQRLPLAGVDSVTTDHPDLFTVLKN